MPREYRQSYEAGGWWLVALRQTKSAAREKLAEVGRIEGSRVKLRLVEVRTHVTRKMVK